MSAAKGIKPGFLFYPGAGMEDGEEERWQSQQAYDGEAQYPFISGALHPRLQALLNTLWVVGSCVGNSLVIIADIYWTLAILSTLYVLTHLIPMTTLWISKVQILTPPLLNCVNFCNFSFSCYERKLSLRGWRWVYNYNAFIIVTGISKNSMNGTKNTKPDHRLKDLK